MLHTDIYPVGIMDIVKHCTYVGMADDVFALLQHKTHLYLANIVNLRY
jgi:DNA mismatch repair protein MLH1